MNKPKMVLFDYGHTLLTDREFSFLRGHEGLLCHATKNPRGLTAEEINSDFAVYGFQAAGSTKDKYAQVIKLKLI